MAAAMASSRWVTPVIRTSEDLLARPGVAVSPGEQVVEWLIGQAGLPARARSDALAPGSRSRTASGKFTMQKWNHPCAPQPRVCLVPGLAAAGTVPLPISAVGAGGRANHSRIGPGQGHNEA